MPTQTIRVPEATHREVQATARLLGQSSADLLARAWAAYRETSEFRQDFEQARDDLARGDLDAITQRLVEHGRSRAAARAARVQELRE